MRPKKSTLLPLAIGLGALGLYIMFGSSGEPAPAPAPGPSPGPVPTSSDHVLGSSGGLMNTHTAQMMLKSLGPAAGSNAMASLIIDGQWGPSTRTAIIAYRSIKGAPGDEITAQIAQVLAQDFQKFVAMGGHPAA